MVLVGSLPSVTSFTEFNWLTDVELLKAQAAQLRKGSVARWESGEKTNLSLIPYQRADLLETGAGLLERLAQADNLRRTLATKGWEGWDKERPLHGPVAIMICGIEQQVKAALTRLDAAAGLIEAAESLVKRLRDEEPRVVNWLRLAEYICQDVRQSLNLHVPQFSIVQSLLDYGEAHLQISRCCR